MRSSRRANPTGTIIAVANQKGGVGKTTICANVAAYIGQGGASVAVIDADPQGSITRLLWPDEATARQSGLFDLLTGKLPAASYLVDIPGWRCRLLPGNFETGMAFSALTVWRRPFDYIANTFGTLRSEADYVFVDMPPSNMPGFLETLASADYVLVPTQLETGSIQGVAFMAHSVQEIKRQLGRAPALLGIVPNQYRRGTTLHQMNLEQLGVDYGALVWPPIPQSIQVAVASSANVPVFEANGDAVTDAFRAVAERVIKNAQVAA